MASIMLVMAIALTSLTSISATNLQLIPVDTSGYPFYPGHVYNPDSFPLQLTPATDTKYTESDGVVLPKGLGIIDIFLLTKLIKRVNQLEEMVKNLDEKSQATAGELASLKSNISIVGETAENTKDKVATIESSLNTVTGTVDGITTKVAKVETGLTTVSETVNGLIKPTSIGGFAKSCLDLQKLGNVKNGLYIIQSAIKIGAVHCDFTLSSTQNGFQQDIGYLNVQTLPVYFYVQKGISASGTMDKITFEIETLNVGGAMAMQTGIFTAPVDGTYFFAFSGVIGVSVTKQIPKIYSIFLKHNGKDAGKKVFLDNFLGSELFIPLPLEATLKLKKNDQIWLSSSVSDNQFLLLGQSYSSFTGILLAEEIPLLQ